MSDKNKKIISTLIVIIAAGFLLFVTYNLNIELNRIKLKPLVDFSMFRYTNADKQIEIQTTAIKYAGSVIMTVAISGAGLFGAKRLP